MKTIILICIILKMNIFSCIPNFNVQLQKIISEPTQKNYMKFESSIGKYQKKYANREISISADKMKKIFQKIDLNDEIVIKSIFLILIKLNITDSQMDSLIEKLRFCIDNNIHIITYIPTLFTENDMKKAFLLLFYNKTQPLVSLKNIEQVRNKLMKLDLNNVIIPRINQAISKTLLFLRETEEYKKEIQNSYILSKTLWVNFCDNPNNENFSYLKKYIENIKLSEEFFFYSGQHDTSIEVMKMFKLMISESKYAIELGFLLLQYNVFHFGGYYSELLTTLGKYLFNNPHQFFEYYNKYQIDDYEIEGILFPKNIVDDEYSMLKEIEKRIKIISSSDFLDDSSREKWINILKRFYVEIKGDKIE